MRRVLLALLAIFAVAVGEVGSTLTPWLVVLDVIAGAVFLTCGVIAAGDRSRFAFAAPAYAAGVLWFPANRAGLLLFAWRPAMVLAMFNAQRGRSSRLERVTVALFVVAAAVPRSSADSWVTLGLSGLLIVAAALRVRTPSTVLSSWLPPASSIALALGLAIPAVAGLMDLPPATSAGFTLVNSGLVSLAGVALLVVAVRERDIVQCALPCRIGTVARIEIASEDLRCHTGTMKRMNLRDVPDDVYAALSNAAATNRQSLSAYVVDRLTEAAQVARLGDYLAEYRPADASQVTLEEAVAAIREVREAS